MKKLLTGLFVLCALSGVGQAQDDLAKSFAAPPDSAKPHTWWHWMNGNITREGITADLEAMQRVGINGAQIFNVDEGIPEGPVLFMSPEWFELFHHAASEAKRLGMELAFHNCAGWSASGGPWVTPEFAMQTVVSSEVQVKGPAKFDAPLPMPEIKLGHYRDISVLAFPTPKGTGKIEGLSGKALSGTSGHGRQSSEAGGPGEAVVMRGEIVDLSASLGEDGKLSWDVPAGEWTILRTGHTPTGAINSPAPESGRGLEVDKLSREAFDRYWAGGVGRILKKLGPLVGGTVNQTLIDSYEVGNCNWTPHFRAEFIKRRGYDPILFLPVLSGRYVDGSEITERFLWDFRRVIGDLYSDNYYGYFSELCRKNGLQACIEPYNGPYESLQAGAKADILMGEFWADPDRGESGSVKLAASLAHTHGMRFVGAESFTADQKRSKWLNHPGSLKALGDLQWSVGVNRFVMHCYPHQPWVEQVPGMTMGRWGTNFASKNTWWEQSRAWMKYIARGQSLLQQGQPVADVLFFGGEASPSGGIHRPDLKARGYDYDAVGTDLMPELTVRDGRVVTPAGTSYRLLVLPNTTGMTPELAGIVRELVRQGATVMGPKPLNSPGLSGFPACDAEVQAIADEVWGQGTGDHRFGKGRVVTGPDVEAVLKQLALVPDFVATGDGPPLSFIHRRIGAAEVYLVANRESRPRRVVCEFRVAGLQPELWDAETGDIADAPCWKIENARTSVTLDLNQSVSIFVVFRRPVKTSASLVQSFTAPPPPAPFHTPVLKILSAHYGSLMVGPDLADVTDPLNRLIRDNRLEVIDYRDFAGDPAPGVMKNMRVTYAIGGRTRTANVTEHEILQLPQEGDGPGELRIVQAVYGGVIPDRVDARPNALADITARVAARVRDNRIAVRIDQDLTGVDPVPGRSEKLWIKYSVDGVEAHRMFGTGSEMRLPEKPASFQPPAPTMAVTASGTVLRVWDAGRYAVKRGSDGDELVTEVDVPEPMAVTGPWEISFQSKRGAPEQAVFENLISWPDHPDDGIKYFSGTATYRRTLEIPASLLGPGKELHLDMGRVKEIAEVRLNGRDLGILWKAPYRVDLGAAARVGKNTLEIEVTNLWPNRLIGDEQLPEDVEWNGLPLNGWPEWLQKGTPRPVPQRVTFTTWHHWRKDSTLLPSGLLGPVVLRPLVVVTVASMEQSFRAWPGAPLSEENPE